MLLTWAKVGKVCVNGNKELVKKKYVRYLCMLIHQHKSLKTQPLFGFRSFETAQLMVIRLSKKTAALIEQLTPYFAKLFACNRFVKECYHAFVFHCKLFIGFEQ